MIIYNTKKSGYNESGYSKQILLAQSHLFNQVSMYILYIAFELIGNKLIVFELSSLELTEFELITSKHLAFELCFV